MMSVIFWGVKDVSLRECCHVQESRKGANVYSSQPAAKWIGVSEKRRLVFEFVNRRWSVPASSMCGCGAFGEGGLRLGGGSYRGGRSTTIVKPVRELMAASWHWPEGVVEREF